MSQAQELARVEEGLKAVQKELMNYQRMLEIHSQLLTVHEQFLQVRNLLESGQSLSKVQKRLLQIEKQKQLVQVHEQLFNLEKRVKKLSFDDGISLKTLKYLTKLRDLIKINDYYKAFDKLTYITCCCLKDMMNAQSHYVLKPFFCVKICRELLFLLIELNGANITPSPPDSFDPEIITNFNNLFSEKRCDHVIQTLDKTYYYS